MDDQAAKRNTTPRPEPLIISELRLNTIAYGWLFVAEVLTRKTSSGKPYLDLKLRDPRGNEIIGRYFDPPDVETQLPQEGKVLELEGLVEKFLNQTYIRVSYAKVDESVPIDLFQVGTRHTISQSFVRKKIPSAKKNATLPSAFRELSLPHNSSWTL